LSDPQQGLGQIQMASRADSQLLLVGSLPAETTATALREAANYFGDLVFALPDGETGARATWIGYEREGLLRSHPDVLTIHETASPTGVPRHFNEAPVFGVRPGVAELRWERWDRVDDAIASYGVFRSLRDEGVIPPHVRFQVGLPFVTSVLSSFKENFSHDFPIAAEAYEELAAREIGRLLAEVPAHDLAIQWDVCHEVLDNESVLPFTGPGAWDRFATSVPRFASLVPEEVLLGYHFCYGTFPTWPMFEARDMELVVRMANYSVGESGRRVDWLHLAGPRYLRSEEERFFAPLADLRNGDARVFLGIVLPIDGVPGITRRYQTASHYLKEFGVAMYCGFGRQPGHDGVETMKEHREAVLHVAKLKASRGA
jgi:hypothetical protein